MHLAKDGMAFTRVRFGEGGGTLPGRGARLGSSKTGEATAMPPAARRNSSESYEACSSGRVRDLVPMRDVDEPGGGAGQGTGSPK
jgi:hypothetical protein